MIRVLRMGGPPPGIEKAANAELGRNRRKTNEKRSFKVYGDDRIKRALEELFRGKRAYCESRYRATQPMDVEHWRPKSLYWFLAADWDNLLPSCIDCNRQRRHMIPMPDGTEVELLLGKMDQFPIEADSPAVDKSGLATEAPLLLNPCDDDPRDHFEFTESGVIRPKAGSRRGETSIRVYALNRVPLVHERYERRLLVARHIHRIRQLALLLEHLEDDLIPASRARIEKQKQLINDLVRHEMNGLRELCDAAQPYALQSRQMVNEFLGEASRGLMPVI